jgi:inner membrane protein
MFLGAVAQSIPDIDFIAAFWMDTTSNLLAHRGFTHSFLFGFLVTFFLAVVSEYWHRKHDIPLRQWMLFFGIELSIHLLLDACNTYGVGWFEPFSHYRVSFNLLFVADPFFSVWLFIAFIALLLLKKGDRRRRKWRTAAMALSSLYLAYCIFNKVQMDATVKNMLFKKNIVYQQYLTTPTPLNNWLWYVAAGDSNGFYIGYRSVFDYKKNINLHYFPRKAYLLKGVADHEALQRLIRFSQGFYTVEKWKDTLVFNDLRFQQVVGWHNPQEKFVFHYFLQHPADNELVVQRGRFAKWDKQTLNTLFHRIVVR